MMALGASASQCCKRSRPRLARPTEPAGWPLHRPGKDTIRRRRISLFSSSSADLLRRPAEARAVAPQAMQDDRQLAGERDLRFGGAASLGHTHASSLQRRPRRHPWQKPNPVRLDAAGKQPIAITPCCINRVGWLADGLLARLHVQAPPVSGRDHPALRPLVLQIRHQLPGP